ncbi:MAG: Mur ligase family protein, partial [Rickettsiales bacterium]
MRYLSDLIGDDIDRRRIRKGWRDLDVVGITSDSRLVRPGFVFAAIEGAKQDGREFIGDAVKNGARAILTQSLPEDYDVVPVPVLYTQNVRYSLAKMAARFYEVQPRWVTAVTGTDGKTSVANFYKQIWQLLGEASASIGTLGIHSQAELPREYPALNTTPDPVILHQALADLARAGVHHVAMEASSIGLDQNRLDGVRVRVAGYTNFTRDHLDYHKTELAYLHAKMGLFTRVLEGGGMAVLNVDDPYFSAFRHHCKRLGHRIMGYGKDARDLTLLSVTPHATG